MLFWIPLSMFTVCSRALGWWSLLAWEMLLFCFRELHWHLADLNDWKAVFSLICVPLVKFSALQLLCACTFLWFYDFEDRGLCSTKEAAAHAAPGVALTTVATGSDPGFVPSIPSPLLRLPPGKGLHLLQRFKTSQKHLAGCSMFLSLSILL